MGKFQDITKELSAKVSAKGTSSFSKADYKSVTKGLLNTPDYTETILVKEGDKVKDVETTPVQRYRNSLKPMVKSLYNIDKDELNKIDNYQFNDEQAEALIGVQTSALKGYLKTGRKFTFPVNSKDESKMSIQIVNVDRKSINTRKIAQNAAGVYESTPTGKNVVTKAHKGIKASNKIPTYLKETK